MLSILSAGDRDILRDATRPSAVFWHRVRTGRGYVIGAAVLTSLLLVNLYFIVSGATTGAWIAPAQGLAASFSLIMVSWLVYIGWAGFRLMPGRNDRVVLNLRHWVRSQVDPLEERMRGLSDDEMRAKRRELTDRLSAGASLDDVRAEAYALVREASRRARNHRQFECQLIGARVIEGGNVAEMRTGEGKTIVCYPANFMKVLQGLKVHMVTVNDYLVKRDAEFCRPIFDLLGVTVGYITSDMESYGPGAEERRVAYACDITYGTNSEFGFDYLRDNMKLSVHDQVQGPQDFAVVDEVDSILIDEARTPLIISGPARDDVRNYVVADTVARTLIRKQEQANREMASRIDEVERTAPSGLRGEPKFRSGLQKFRKEPLWLDSEEAEMIGLKQYYVVELDRHSAHMTEHGAKAAQQELGIGTFYDSRNMNWPHYIDNALKAHLCYLLDKEYVIQDDKIVIVDEFTGRLMHGRQWSDGLHQAVEAKEKVTVKQENQTLATITLQNLFKLYGQLAGMTGTAMTEAEEFMKIYRLEVIAIPTNRPVRRIDYNDKIYKNINSKFEAIVNEIRSYSQNGYPDDPYSLYDILREARKILRERRKSAENAAEYDAQIARVDAAVKAADKGNYEDGILERTYLELAGERVGGRPILVGTVSVESSEKLSQALSRRFGIEHEVLNAKNHAREADIVAKAGQQHEEVRNKKKMMVGNVTIATNMAGRGTDIVLGPGVADIGGLHVVGTERHESRRIDNQLRGRCGRQGDPGSTRFFLSFEDDLIKLFMADWLIKWLSRVALEENVPIEHRTMNKGIAKAQKRVEERNFGIRKQLLDYDEVRDQQRLEFYTMRQAVLEGRSLSETVWEMIDESVADAVDRYYDPLFRAHCVVEWATAHMGVAFDADRLDTADRNALFDQVRDLASHDVRGHVQRTFGEYVDTDIDPDEWDVRGLASWISQYGMNLTQRQIRESDPGELCNQIIEAAIKRIEETDLSPLDPILEPLFAKARLASWAQDKFGLKIPLDDLAAASRDDAEQIIRDKMRAAYRKREIDYPPSVAVAVFAQRAGTNRNQFYEQIAQWAGRRFGVDWTYEHFDGKSPQDVYDELRAVNEDFLSNGRLDKEIEQALAKVGPDGIAAWARTRFGPVSERADLSNGPDLKDRLRQCGYEMLRQELTQLEQTVLLRTYDTAWKDHMYSMDLLRGTIGLRGYAERDPRIEFKREGTRMFAEMKSNIRDRVTDLIFKLNVATGPDGGAGGGAGGAPVAAAPGPAAPPGMTATKADATGAGFAGGQGADYQAAMAKQGEGAAQKTFKREQPKVGRNDPCPCGSGKKYKQCHGKGS